MPYETFLEEIKQRENPAIIKTTRDYCLEEEAFATTDRDFIEFKSSIWWQLLKILWGFIWIVTLYQFYLSSRNKGMRLLGYAIAGFLFAGVLVKAIREWLDRSTDFTIQIDHLGITVAGNFFYWADISETAILYKRGRKYLLIANNATKTYKTFDLLKFKTYNISAFPLVLSEYIEFFKPRQ